MFKIGPAGNTNEYDGSPWEEKDRNGIAQIFISHGDKIHSLQFQFVENGTLVLSKQHGNLHCAPKFSAVKLNYPSEFITGISGYSGKRDYEQCVTSIIFTTNNATYGPFGCPTEDDIAFDYQMGGCNKFCGFYGSAGDYLYSIGVYMEPMTTLSNVNRSSHSVHIPEQTKELVESLKLDVDTIKQQSEKSVQLQKELIDLVSNNLEKIPTRDEIKNLVDLISEKPKTKELETQNLLEEIKGHIQKLEIETEKVKKLAEDIKQIL